MNVQLLLVPYDSARRGWRMGAGPEALAARGLAPALEAAGRSVHLRTIEPLDGAKAEIGTAFDLMAVLSGAVREARSAGRFPLVLAGNCSTAVGTVAGLDLGGAAAALWFDAHGDFNTPETTLGGFLDGMAVATLTGRCWRELARRVPGFQPVPESAACLLGTRDLDPLEAEALAASSVRTVPPDALSGGLDRVLAEIAPATGGAYVHVDLDVLDPAEGRVNEFAAASGLSLAALLDAVGRIGRRVPVRAAAITAYDPALDDDGRVARAAIQVAVALTEAAGEGLGRKILEPQVR